MEEEYERLANNRKKSWSKCAKDFNEKFGTNVSGDTLRKRVFNYKKSDKYKQTTVLEETHSDTGEIVVKSEIFFDKDEEKSPENILKKFGYDPKKWKLEKWQFGKWEVAIKSEKQNRICTTIKATIKPIIKDRLTLDELQEIARESVKNVIKPIALKPAIFNETLDKDLMIEFPATELHLGKLAWGEETGENYDSRIAKKRFENIIQKVYETQTIVGADRLFMTIGNDFFNSDTVDDTTTKGTLQNNDLRWKKMFLMGLEMYKRAIYTLRHMFNRIDIQLCQGNHDVMSSFYLFEALKQYFVNDNIVHFSENVKTTQSYTWGSVAIFTSHGDSNLKRLIKSIPAEFYEEWGKSRYRELHLGHLHKEVVVDDESGMITRRLGSPSGTDAWHYNSRFIGATQKQQLFVWHKQHGLLDIKYICFKGNEED